MRTLRVLAATAALALPAACTLALTCGISAASATTRFRSGTLHTELAGHVAANQGGIPSEVVPTGADITAAVVGALALLSLVFVVVTLIRRRITPSSTLIGAHRG
jgi:hypothetical protein